MVWDELTIGIVGPSAETRSALRSQLSAAGIAARIEESAQYCLNRNDSATRKILMARPVLVFVDLDNAEAGIQTLRVLQATLPEVWLFVLAEKAGPEVLIESMRAGARDLIAKPIAPKALLQALSRFMNERARPDHVHELGNVYCVTTGKGGSGVTTVAINLAASLSQIESRRVAFVDLNYPVGDAAAYLNIRPEFTLSDALAAANRLDTMLLESYMTRVEKVAVLAGFRDYRPGSKLEPEALAKVLEVALSSYQDVVIDLPSWLDAQTLHTVTDLSRLVLVVLTPELPALWRTERLLRFFEQNGSKEKVRIVLNRASKRNDITEKEIIKVLNMSVFWRFPNNYATSIEAINTGKPLVSVNHSELAGSYRELAEELCGVPKSEKASLFGFLFR